MAGLLNTLKKNWRGLLDEVQAAPESLRALTQPAAAQQFDAALRKGGTIDKEKAVQMAMDVLQTTPMGVMGKIVYHGSPHKFDKFDMSKIGTGEGVQAYGHGLYFAENPKVAMSYKDNLALPNLSQITVDGVEFPSDFAGGRLLKVASGPRQGIGSLGLKQQPFDIIRAELADLVEKESIRKPPRWAYKKGNESVLASYIDQQSTNLTRYKKWLDELDSVSGKNIELQDNGNLYKVDIPDEAVSRMLEWDKPLRMQPEAYRQQLLELAKQKGILDPNGSPEGVLGKGLYEGFGDGLNSPQTAEQLKALGIPGIRYLDGGSRAAGGGTSNFVLFDDQLPRILERNGTPTGLNPWAPGEWRGLLEP